MKGSNMQTIRQSIEITRLIDKFVAKVRRVKEVKKVLLVEGGGFPGLWTVLDAKPFDLDVNRPVYDAEGDFLRALDQPLLDFRVINLSEIDEDQHPYVIPQDATVLYERQ